MVMDATKLRAVADGVGTLVKRFDSFVTRADAGMSRVEKKVAEILASGDTDKQKISKLQIVALKAYPSSPDQRTAREAYEALMRKSQ